MIQEREKEVIDILLSYEDVSDRFKYIIEQKNEKYQIEDKYKTNENKVFGCQSDLWIIGILNKQTVSFKYYSEGIFPNGITKVLIDIIDNTNIKEIIEYQPKFLEQTNLINFISPNRKIGIQSLIGKIKTIALELKKNAGNNQIYNR